MHPVTEYRKKFCWRRCCTCIRNTVLSPQRHQKKFSPHMSAETLKSHHPKAWGHFYKNVKTPPRGPGVVSKFCGGLISPFFVRINPCEVSEL